MMTIAIAAFKWIAGPIGRYVVAAVALAGMLWFVHHQWTGYKNGLIAQGVALCQARHAAEIQRMNNQREDERRTRMLDREKYTAAIRDAEDARLAALRAAQQARTELTRGTTNACETTGLSASFGLQFNEAAAAYNN